VFPDIEEVIPASALKLTAPVIPLIEATYGPEIPASPPPGILTVRF